MQFNRKGVQRKHKEKADFCHQMTVKNCSRAQSISLPCFEFFRKRNFSAIKLTDEKHLYRICLCAFHWVFCFDFSFLYTTVCDGSIAMFGISWYSQQRWGYSNPRCCVQTAAVTTRKTYSYSCQIFETVKVTLPVFCTWDSPKKWWYILKHYR